MCQRSQKFGGCLSRQQCDFALCGGPFGRSDFVGVFQSDTLVRNEAHQSLKIARWVARNGSEFRQRIAVGLFLGKDVCHFESGDHALVLTRFLDLVGGLAANQRGNNGDPSPVARLPESKITTPLPGWLGNSVHFHKHYWRV